MAAGKEVRLQSWCGCDAVPLLASLPDAVLAGLSQLGCCVKAEELAVRCLVFTAWR